MCYNSELRHWCRFKVSELLLVWNLIHGSGFFSSSFPRVLKNALKTPDLCLL